MKILVINGPNLNMLGKRESSLYGVKSLADIEALIEEKARDLDVDIETFQSNSEGAIIDYLQEAASDAEGIIVNAGALTHYGLSLRDALVDSRLPIVEVHLSNIHARDEFRRRSVVADIAQGQIAGLGWRGYIFALEFLVGTLRQEG
ncbi:MAG: type II 3-dehydroquinate dehydratase [Chloroflexi bacterium]|nr:type II 3-dehydroquinate dehydratase [Chloroflexota bacterium]MCH7652596.1 type II 3-dehydroquinate dehydratase [Chloroflexota bacterium]